jgi:transcriptional regulator with XRE-family HTH domain
MVNAQRKPPRQAEAPEPTKKPRNDPQRLKAFAHRLNVMLAELGLPERRRASLITKRIGVSRTAASNWLRGDSYPGFEELARMNRLGVDPTRLFPDKSEVVRRNATQSVASSDISQRLAHLIEAEQLTMLYPLESDDGEWDHTALPNSMWRHVLGRSLKGCFLIYMNGDSMGERIKDGTPLLVDTNMTQIADDNAIYALLVNNAVIIRRVRRRLQGGYVIVADNPAIAAETIEKLGSHLDDSAKARDVLVLGRVALAMQKL